MSSLVSAKQVFLEAIFKYTFLGIFCFCAIRLFFKYSIAAVMSLVYPMIAYVAVFGFTNIFDLSQINLLSDYIEQPQTLRYASAQADMKYAFKTITFETFVFLYYTQFIPVHLARGNPREGGLYYIDYGQIWKSALFSGVVFFCLKFILYVEKRQFEMKFNLEAIGYWRRLSSK
mmetsp:Transcript_26122/g.39921  ORF Transcript_26122/g.39921 Transcript_26122/m.39921 type:complete len:174 (-) Transcript_26122:441-962(-)|eukprot:CAMPEP_0170488736 /NCGR_PEP_ID=MMETSP0208-20121228/7223_1 /TAXON_ID=197538 /ORGANISM="Strombidium inclinatum, Strain S3" /LENGTH=173 /DNA_ID=CAMNT_0010763407 /DNA_START=373 /DNA_END=894 /DNA_ORIENTATION=+